MIAAAQTGFFIDLSTARVPPQTAPKVAVLLRMEWTKSANIHHVLSWQG